MMISLARAGPTSRTKRVAEATPSGTPRSTSGIQSWASAAAMRKSQARVSPQPPPTAWPLMAAMVVCSRLSSTALARSKSRRNWLLRDPMAARRSSGDMLLLSPASAPAEKTGGAPVTMTTRVVGSSRSSVKAAPSSVSMASLSELRRSGRVRGGVGVGVAWPRWFPEGRLNFTDNCVDRHLDAGRGAKPAIVWEGDDGQSRTLSYAELALEVNRLANGLKALGIAEGDRVGVFLPMSPEAAIATLAVVKIGAIYTPCFSGFGAGAVASRLADCEARALITADGFYRRGQVVRMKETADEAVAQCPSATTVVVYRRLGREIPWTPGRDHWWHEAVAGQSERAAALPVDADRPCLIIYTSGTTGRPKGAVLTHGGFLLKTAHDFGYCMDVGESDRLFWLTDLGWLMGPMAFTGAPFPR